ncbi:uncharacterized protein LOC135427560 [Drosophila montana]|uniref:uncharacterized protein LOC135427560 n=1 Tax=Drosophila montana TaxID=40370 RepID=UPI00313D434D
MQFSGCLAIVLLASIALTTSLPMANEDELVALDSVEQVEQPQDMRHILKIAPKQADTELAEERTGVYDTIVEELRAAGIQTSEQKPLPTLSYKELTRLLALWHMTQGRNFYEAEGQHAHGTEQFVAAATTRPIPS